MLNFTIKLKCFNSTIKTYLLKLNNIKLYIKPGCLQNLLFNVSRQLCLTAICQVLLNISESFTRVDKFK